MKLNVDSHGNGTSGGTINIPASAFAGLNTTDVNYYCRTVFRTKFAVVYQC